MSLTENLVPLPGHSRLAILIGADSIDVAVTSRVSDNSLIWRHIPYGREWPSTIQALENAIYDNPLLLSDFAEVDILYDSPRFLAIPQQQMEADEDADTNLLQGLYPGENFTAVTAAVSGGAVISAAVDSDVHEFVTRTFPRVRTAHRLVPLCNYRGRRSSGASNGCMYIHLRHGFTDIIAFNDGQLMMVNTFSTPTVADALYYSLAAARSLNFDTVLDRMEVSGGNALREELMPMLRKHVETAVPAIFPSAILNAGHDAMDAPFELMVLPFLT